MKLIVSSLAAFALIASAAAAPVPLFNGKSFEGWEGDTEKTWRIQDGAIVGGSLTEKVPRNEFLATKKTYKNFDLSLKFKLVGTEGFVNSGVQIRSVRIPKPPNEMRGYQADIGDPKWWGCIYDESRRNKVMAQSDMAKLEPVLKRQDWNDYRIRAVGPRIQIWINGVQSVDYTEEDASIEQDGHIAVQVHGGGKAEVYFKDIQIEELPADAKPEAADAKAAAVKQALVPGAATGQDPPPAAGETSAKLPTPAPSAGVPAKGGNAQAAVAKDSSGPLTAEQERASFRLPEGFVAELVADESVMGKAVAFNFDNAGRMWVTTASEYPLDANEQPDLAERLYREGGKDAVLIFDTPWAPGLQKPRVFAGNPPSSQDATTADQSAIRNPKSAFPLAMPMGVLPYKDGAIVQHGPDLLFLRDTDKDGRADQKEVLLTGFGIQDSHLMPHGFTRGPGDWIYFAQGAFNTSQVKTKEGPVVTAKHCKLMRMKPDGSKFEIVGWGLNNIWGFVIDPRGEMWVQEANDMGYPVAPFQVGMAYPGIGSDKPKPYAPFMPPPRKLNDCTMGGTGLSGLALSEDPETWPAPWTGAFMIANPITNKIQAVRVHRERINRDNTDASWATKLVPLKAPGSDYHEDFISEKLPDFLVSDDKSFRPVAIQFGPDGSLYVIDWYNKIISHNEVPRSHPERDKTRSRIWRIRTERRSISAAPALLSDRIATNGIQVSDLAKAADHDLPQFLTSRLQWAANAARFEILDRPARELAEALWKVGEKSDLPVPAQLQLLWIEPAFLPRARGNRRVGVDPALRPWVLESHPEGARLSESIASHWWPDFDERSKYIADVSFPTATQVLRILSAEPQSLIQSGLLVPTHVSHPERLNTAERREQAAARLAFLRQLVRQSLERAPDLVRQVIAFKDRELPLSRFYHPQERVPSIFYLSLPPAEGAELLAQSLLQSVRGLEQEEIGLLAGNLGNTKVKEILAKLLRDKDARPSVLAALRTVPTIEDPAFLESVADSVKQAFAGSNQSERGLILNLTKRHRILALEPNVYAIAAQEGAALPERIEAIRTLGELGSTRLDFFANVAITRGKESEHANLQREAVSALTSSKDARTVEMLAKIWPDLPPPSRKLALGKLTGSKLHAATLVNVVTGQGPISPADLDDADLDKLGKVLGPQHPEFIALLSSTTGATVPVLRLGGGHGEIVPLGLTLEGPFTVEAWIRLSPGITNEDVLLGSPEGPNFNFYDGRLRVYAGGRVHDALAAQTPIKAETWTHVAISRDAANRFRIYLNGELNAEGGKAWDGAFKKMDLGRNNLGKGSEFQLTELRVWKGARTAEEIRDHHTSSIAGEPTPSELHFAIYADSGDAAGSLRTHPAPPPDSLKRSTARTRDYPELLTASAARALDEKFTQFRNIVAQAGDATKGRTTFAGMCAACHRVKGEGGQIGPDLSGAGAMGTEALLRNILTPNAQLESGYYRYDVELTSGDLLSGFLVKEDPKEIVLRPLGSEDRTIPRTQVKKSTITRKSLMPEGLIDTLPPESIRDLFAYLATLK